MRKFLKNKFVLVSTIAIICYCTYLWFSKIIKDYNYSTGIDIVTTEDEENINKELSNDDNKKKDCEKTSDDIGDGVTEEELEKNDENINSNMEIENQKESDKKIYVYITGEVITPGVLMLKENSRIIDAINSAGGTTNNANISKINLAYVLKDGMKINIPSLEELKNNSDFEYITMSSGDGKNDENTSSESIENSANEKKLKSTKTSLVNINTASQTELETLPGIGPSIALKIINYRNENGKFSTVDDIKNVNGIGETKFENIKKYITV